VEARRIKVAATWRHGGSKLQRCGSERRRCEGATCRKWWVIATVGVEWLSVSVIDQSRGDVEVRRIRAPSTRRRSGSERLPC
jgi:hypothetical protein